MAEKELMSQEALALCEALDIMAQAMVKRGVPASELINGWRRVAKGHQGKGRVQTAGLLEVLAARLSLPANPPEGHA